MKSRAIRFQAGLPVYLWPWTTQTAGYIMNRTSLAKHSWKTPFEMATGKKPNLAHFVQYGAKAYPVDKEIPNLEKMRAKAHIGFLVGYDSTNIWLIWVPSQRKVIRTRDVTFDEDSQYRSHEIDAAQLINEPFLSNDTLKIPQSDFTRLIEIESDSEDELFELKPTGTIAVDSPKAEEAISKDDARGYLPSPTPSSLRGRDTPQKTSSDPRSQSPSDTKSATSTAKEPLS